MKTEQAKTDEYEKKIGEMKLSHEEKLSELARLSEDVEEAYVHLPGLALSDNEKPCKGHRDRQRPDQDHC